MRNALLRSFAPQAIGFGICLLFSFVLALPVMAQQTYDGKY